MKSKTYMKEMNKVRNKYPNYGLKRRKKIVSSRISSRKK